MMPQVGGRVPNVLRKERVQWKAFNEGLTANLVLRTLRGLCKAEALRFIISRVCPSTRLPTGVYASSCKMWLDLFRTTHLWMIHKWWSAEPGRSRRSNGTKCLATKLS